MCPGSEPRDFANSCTRRCTSWKKAVACSVFPGRTGAVNAIAAIVSSLGFRKNAHDDDGCLLSSRTGQRPREYVKHPAPGGPLPCTDVLLAIPVAARTVAAHSACSCPRAASAWVHAELTVPRQRGIPWRTFKSGVTRSQRVTGVVAHGRAACFRSARRTRRLPGIR
jgi:hypothetical protein